MASTTTFEGSHSYNWLGRTAAVVAIGATLLAGAKLGSDSIEQHCQQRGADIMQTPSYPEGLCNANQTLRDRLASLTTPNLLPQPSLADRPLGS